MYTRQHFELIADVIRQTRADLRFEYGPETPDILDRLSQEFADRLTLENPRFERERFLAAAGWIPTQGDK